MPWSPAINNALGAFGKTVELVQSDVEGAPGTVSKTLQTADFRRSNQDAGFLDSF
jgi:hypothetical protein